MIVEKVSDDEFLLYEILRNPILFSEFIANIDKDEGDEEFELTQYQKEFMADFNSYVSLACARAVGKTVSLSFLIIWALVFGLFNEYVLYTVPSKVHLEPVFTNLVRFFRTNSFLSKTIYPQQGINHSDFSIKLMNEARLICRIAGQSGTGANVVGLHTPFILLDEAGYYPWQAFVELQPVLNTWQRGFRMIVSGVPSGLRENNVLYHCDIENPNYSRHRVSAFQNPRFTEEDRRRAIEQYGGEDSEDYIHFVLGQHGRPVFAVFDRTNFEILSYPVYKISIDGANLDLNSIVERLSLLPPLPKKAPSYFGIDLGYSEPTAIIILYEEGEKLRFHARIKLLRVPYPVQEMVIDYLDSRFDPKVIGIDKGGVGVSIVQSLREKYSQKRLPDKIYPVDFASNLSLGISSDGEEIVQKTRPYAINALQELANSKKLVFSSTDTEMIAELENMSYRKNPSGEIVYSTLTPRGGSRGEDHFTSALLCATLPYYLENTTTAFSRKPRRFFKPFWLE